MDGSGEGRRPREEGMQVMIQRGCHLLATSYHCNTSELSEAALLVDPVGEAPAALGVGVSVSRVDEAVLERPTDVVSRQTRDRRHHISGELSHLQRALVLTPPPVVLSSTESEGNGEEG